MPLNVTALPVPPGSPPRGVHISRPHNLEKLLYEAAQVIGSRHLCVAITHPLRRPDSGGITRASETPGRLDLTGVREELTMNRFKTSKYKNTTPKIPKKDGWIANVRGGFFSSQGRHITSSCSLVAFNTDHAGGGTVGLSSVAPGADGRWTLVQISCHTDLVTDLDFSPFDDALLATCSADQTVKLWRVCDPRSDPDPPSNPTQTLSPGDGRLELLLFHPTASNLLSLGSERGVQLWDCTRDAALTGEHTLVHQRKLES
ncbi:hypothetical protein DNTS_020571 [Danionella cerebrum]|uniref:Coronin n=1 Tax=Danionella cerebrum TaxID=2873325 RepID=A0A553R519_9TELE|nr:hypothetical protein DNTS_020571 [Danionella translucida]